jgi:hypothetical protein
MSTFKIERDPKIIGFRNEEERDPTKLINFLSNTRTDQLRTLFGHNTAEILELEKKYGKYLYVPLALPVFEMPEKDHFFSWWKERSIVPSKIGDSHVSPGTGYASAESVDLIDTSGISFWTANKQTDSFIKEFPILWQQFNDLLPMSNIIALRLWSSFIPFTEHRDHGELIDIPMSFRIKLYDENPEETLYFLENTTKPYEHGKDTQIRSVPGTNSWAWNNLRVKHGSVYNPGYKKFLVISTGIVDPKKYETLMDKSINLYKDYCVVSENSLGNYVNV